MNRQLALATALGSLLALASPARSGVIVPTGFVDDTLVTGLNEPNSMAFLPDGRLLFTETRTGKVRMIVNGHIAASDPLLTVPDLQAHGYEQGLQGIAVDPGWPARPYIYTFYNRFGEYIRLIRYKGSGDLSNPSGETLSFHDSLIIMNSLPDNNPNHNSGCLRFGPDGYLYVSLGDDEAFCQASDSTSFHGAILRLDMSRLPLSGQSAVPLSLITPPSNPLNTTDPVAKLVWAYGFRNPWRYQIDPQTGAIYNADVGENIMEEIDETLPGDFGGWPWREGTSVVVRAQCPEPGGSGFNSFKPPIVAMARGPDPTAFNCAGMYRPVPGAPNNWPAAYTGTFGDVFYGEYYSGMLRRLKKMAGVWSPAAAVAGQPDPDDWATGLVSATDFLVGPDGSLYWIAQFDPNFSPASGTLQRIRYTGDLTAVTDPPVAARGLGTAPNPFARETMLSFRVASREPVGLFVYDLAGRRVRRLFEGEAEAGERRLAWDGRDDAGAPVAPGVYLVRLDRARLAPQFVRLVRLR